MDEFLGSASMGIVFLTLLLLLLFVPFRDIKRFTPFGLIAGSALALAFFLLGGPILDLWSFRGPLVLGRIPVMLVITWYPVEILFAYGLELLEIPRRRAGLILLVAAVSMFAYVYLRAHGVWQERVSLRESRVFLFALILHSLFAVYLGRRRRKTRSSIPPLV